MGLHPTLSPLILGGFPHLDLHLKICKSESLTLEDQRLIDVLVSALVFSFQQYLSIIIKSDGLHSFVFVTKSAIMHNVYSNP